MACSSGPLASAMASKWMRSSRTGSFLDFFMTFLGCPKAVFQTLILRFTVIVWFSRRNMPEPPDALSAPPSFWHEVMNWNQHAPLCVWGAGIASLFALGLTWQRWPESWMSIPLGILALIFITWSLVPHRIRPDSEIGGLLIFCVSVGTPLCFGQHSWTTPVLAITCSAGFWALGKVQRRRVPITVTGILLAGAAAPLLHWPAVQQYLPLRIFRPLASCAFFPCSFRFWRCATVKCFASASAASTHTTSS
ncbi:membrane hypothetical protein [Candidatus Sulfopaludibacter sp. SbA3]|nr:membrane hypothetical protein [Candidatus Sulfopaludibacter sp. SbA3]